MNNFFIITNKLRDKDLSVTERTRRFLESNGCNVYFRDEGPRSDGRYTSDADIPGDTECVITIGGDGTLIAAARDTVDLSLPILGINQGTLGYLADVEVDNIEESLTKIMKGEYSVEDRMMLCGKVFDADGALLTEARALNDVVIRNTELKPSDFSLNVNSKYLGSYKADGMIVCTPTGSTAYSMSAGGPIIEPMAEMMVITPVCPHTLNGRSIVISGKDRVEIRVEDDFNCVNFDGYDSFRLKRDYVVSVRSSSRVTRIIKLGEDSFLRNCSRII